MDTAEEKADRDERLREMLLRKREEIEGRIGEELGAKMTEDIASTLGPAMDEGDLSNLEAARDLDYELLNMSSETLRNIDRALERLEEGTYGTCEECGLEIGERRLKAMPFARYCVNCQEEKERFSEKGKGRGWVERRPEGGENQTNDDEGS
jgi:DnaK suppressor protein